MSQNCDLMPPLSKNLRDFTGYSGQPSPFGERVCAALQSCLSWRSLLPESFRGGCSFGVKRSSSISPAQDVLYLAIQPRKSTLQVAGKCSRLDISTSQDILKNANLYGDRSEKPVYTHLQMNLNQF